MRQTATTHEGSATLGWRDRGCAVGLGGIDAAALINDATNGA